MKHLVQRLQQHLPLNPRFFCLLASIILTAGAPAAQAAGQSPTPAVRATARISAEVTSSQLTTLSGSKRPMATAKYDIGRLAPSTKLQGISLYFSRSQSQEADLKALLAAQQNPASPLYHQWLTPEQFGSRFGMADSDIAKVQSWLERQGFAVESVGRAKDMIRFSGTSAQVESAFATEIHNYSIPTAKGVEKHFAPSSELSVPSALAGVVLTVRNLDDFRVKSHVVASRPVHAKPSFTSGQTGNVYFAPGDITTIYDIQKMYNSSFTGTGQSIAVIGQSAIEVGDIEAFQSAAGLPVKDPTLVLVPGTGSSTLFTGDETESDLDLEWSGAIAKGATISFVYTGDASTSGAFDALKYAIDNRIANIVSSSYGDCETDLGSFTLEPTFQEAAAQGQTVISAAGDDGATDCFEDTNLTVAQQQALAVDYPASSPYVTGMGGTQISGANASYLTPGDGYWSDSTNGSDVISSALQYIPEVAWNEDSANCGFSVCLNSGGGGASALFAKPSWQTGVSGSIPNDAKRDVPDISLNSSTGTPGYLFCSSDNSFWGTGQQASCDSGFRDSVSGLLTSAGGTSFAAPIFAGMLALVNQQQNYTTGQGLINPTLYTLASNPTTYAAAFHDITGGNNDCPKGTGLCNSTVTGFAAGTGYDQVTGLGTIDLFNLANAWPASTGPALIGTTTTVSASNAAPVVNASDTFTITVASTTAGTPVPTGTVTITIDSGTPITGNTLTANGTFTYTTSFATAGAHAIIAAYSGDATYAASTGTASVNVGVVNSGKGTFTISATNITVAQGSAGSSTVTVTPAGGYTGTVQLSVSTTSTDLQNDSCLVVSDAVISGTAPSTGTVTVDTNALNCLNTGQARKGQGKLIHKAGFSAGLEGHSGPVPAIAVFAGLLLAGVLGRYSRKLRVLAGVILLATVGMAFTGCGSNNNNTVSNPPKGTYTLTLTGTDSSSSSVPSATTTFTLTIQ